MGYETYYNGTIEIKSDKCKSLIKNYLLDDNEGEYEHTLFDSEFDESNGILKLHEDRRNYNEEMEVIFNLIAYYDREAIGEIVAEGEDGDNKEKFIIMGGKVFREEGYISYKNKKDITGEPYNLEYAEEVLNSIDLDNRCDICNSQLNKKSFNFKNRGYYNEIIENTKYKNLCENCYHKIKEPFAKKEKLKRELIEQEREILKLK